VSTRTRTKERPNITRS